MYSKQLHKACYCLLFWIFTLPLVGQTIPQEWEGKWEGVVNIWTYNQIVDSFPMSLEITARDSTWDFVITYQRDANNPDIRSYELVVIDEAKHHYAIDEKNSIILDTYFYDNCLYSIFGGMGSELQTRICLSGQTLDYEISSHFSDPLRVSGNEQIGMDTIPAIRSYDLYNIMKAKLQKN